MRKYFLLKSVTVLALLALSPFTAEAKSNVNQKTHDDITATFGFVPTFLKEFPADALPGAWSEMKAVQLSPTALSPKTKELIGLAVAAQIPCSYCVYFHRKGAETNGASVEELNTAVTVSSITRKWSAYFNGAELDMKIFKSDVDNMAARMKKHETVTVINVTDETTAYQDAQNHFGFVPTFIQTYFKPALAGAWNEVKAVHMNPNGVISGKDSELISLAVSSQIPSAYNTYLDSSFARANGASDLEIREAVAVAGEVRHWSTFMNGSQQNQRVFENEVDRAFKHIKAKAQKPQIVSQSQ